MFQSSKSPSKARQHFRVDAMYLGSRGERGKLDLDLNGPGMPTENNTSPPSIGVLRTNTLAAINLNSIASASLSLRVE